MLRALAIASLLAACGGAADPPPEKAAPAAKAAPPECAEAPGWRSERIELPPEFAPSLPAGTERLYFAPGMFERGAPDFWSYVFALRFESASIGGAELERLFTDYYRGLIGAVAKQKGIAFDPESVVTRRAGGALEIAIVDAFGSGEPVELRLEVRAGARCLSVAASPAAPDAPLWSRLRRVRDGCVPCD